MASIEEEEDRDLAGEFRTLPSARVRKLIRVNIQDRKTEAPITRTMSTRQ